MSEQQGGAASRIDPRSFLILDDCLYDDTWTRDLNIRYLFLNGRWVKVFFLITMQYPLGIAPVLRTNVDYVFILREPYLNNRRRIFENYGSAFPSFEFFCQVMDQCTTNYECLVVSNNTIPLEPLPENPHWIFSQLLWSSCNVGLGENEIKERWCYVHGVSRANDGNLRVEPLLKHKLERVVRLFNPTSVINDTFTFEPTCLESNIW